MHILIVEYDKKVRLNKQVNKKSHSDDHRKNDEVKQCEEMKCARSDKQILNN